MAKIIGMDGKSSEKKVTGSKPQMGVDLSKSTEMVCKECGHNVFIPGAMFRKISKIYTGTAKDAVIPIEVYLCGDCGTINEELLPAEIKLKQDNK